MPNLANRRLDGTLSSNELRSYLEGKPETSGKVCAVQAPTLERVKALAGDEVVLISPPATVPSYAQRRCIPPLGLSYIAASLRKNGIKVSIIDAVVEGYATELHRDGMVTYGLTPDDLVSRISKTPGVIGVTVPFSTDFLSAVNLCGRLKEAFPEAVTVMGGLHPTIYPHDVFKAARPGAVDFVIRGEGEVRLVSLIKGLQAGVVDTSADGLCGTAAGKHFVNAQREVIADLDSLPFPAYDLLPVERYFEINVPFSPVPKGSRVLPMFTTRGCPIGCSFCASTNMYKSFRCRSVENVVKEIAELQLRYNVDEVQFADDNLTLKRPRSVELFSAMRSLGVMWCTPNGTMVNTLDSELLDLMQQSGLYQVTLSVDSASVRTLRELHHKPVNLNSVPGLIATCQQRGVWTHGTLVVGMPGETLDETLASFDYVNEHLDFDSISVFIAHPLPGSELFHAALDAGSIARESAWSINTGRSVFGNSGLEDAVSKFQTEFTESAKLRRPDVYAEKYKRFSGAGRECPPRLT